ncbi:hypothetical protein O1611_g3703 [Lasiodiplodia mahajangana]|uniref:Uncharacterized protein n=1 Tax=Lasiodiplodia mahajangana TaxID=1108764 RepID=A0ACC2JR83_9PEZI|nr:hypothetical protein O1611_g3703 [Lasiodiplodia mahajangana]
MDAEEFDEDLYEEQGWDVDGMQRAKTLLSQYFSKDEEKRFQLEGPFAGGTSGIAWMLRYTPPGPTPRTQRIILKTDRADMFADEESSIPQEKKFLEILQWAKHIVNIVPIPKDPLGQDRPGLPWHQMEDDHWIYMEYLQNGTLETLISRAVETGVVLPNRLLWRFFLCLIRTCIAMGWPPSQPADGTPANETATGDPHGGLIHGDMHEGNVMLGDFDPPDDAEAEHTLAPILKLIDLGAMRQVINTADNMKKATANNLFDIGILMVELVALDTTSAAVNIVPNAAVARPVVFVEGGPPVLTNGTVLLRNENTGIMPFPTLDAALRNLICRCLATRPEDRPDTLQLAAFVVQCINERDATYYARLGFINETDSYVRDVIQELVFDAI